MIYKGFGAGTDRDLTPIEPTERTKASLDAWIGAALRPIAGAALTSRRRPPPREHLLHPGLGEALVDQDQNATVLIAPDDPPCCLNDLAHARVEIGVIEPRTKLPPQTLLELLVDRVDLG